MVYMCGWCLYMYVYVWVVVCIFGLHGTPTAAQQQLSTTLPTNHTPTGIMLQNLFNAYATVAFFQFVIFAIFEMRYLLSVWRARRSNADPWTAQRELSMLYARFYGVLLGGMLLMFQLVKYDDAEGVEGEGGVVYRVWYNVPVYVWCTT